MAANELGIGDRACIIPERRTMRFGRFAQGMCATICRAALCRCPAAPSMGVLAHTLYVLSQIALQVANCAKLNA